MLEEAAVEVNNWIKLLPFYREARIRKQAEADLDALAEGRPLPRSYSHTLSLVLVQ